MGLIQQNMFNPFELIQQSGIMHISFYEKGVIRPNSFFMLWTKLFSKIFEHVQATHIKNILYYDII